MESRHRKNHLLLDQALRGFVEVGEAGPEDEHPAAVEPTPGPALEAADPDRSESYACPSRRCQARRERNHLLESELFEAEWREMKVAGMGVWVVDISLRCPNCRMRHTRTLLPPVLQAITLRPAEGRAGPSAES